MERSDLQRGVDLDVPEAGIARGKKIEVGHLAEAQEARAKAWQPAQPQPLPAVESLTSGLPGPGKRPSKRGEEGLGGGQARVESVTGRDDHVNLTQRGEPWGIGFEHGPRNRRHGARSAHHQYPGALCLRFEGRDAVNELTGIGEVDIVHPGGDAGARQPVVLTLIGSRGTDQHRRRNFAERGRGDVLRIETDAPDLGARPCRKPRCEALRLLDRSAGHDHLDAGHPHQPLCGKPSKGSVAADYEHTLQAEPRPVSDTDAASRCHTGACPRYPANPSHRSKRQDRSR